MTSPSKLIKTLRMMKPKSPVCEISVILLLSSLLTGCATVSPVDQGSLSQSLLYSPPVLRLPAGKPVQTLEGLYTPKNDEVWQSDARFRQMEQQLLDATTTITELKSH